MRTLIVDYETLRGALNSTASAGRLAYFQASFDPSSYVLKLITDDFEWSTTLPPEQPANITHFEQNLKASSIPASSADDAIGLALIASRTLIVPKSSDGRVAVRTTITNKGSNLKLRAISLWTCAPARLHSRDPRTHLEYGDVTQTMVDAAGDTTVDPTQCVMDVIDFEPRYSYEVDGGFMDVPSDLIDGVTDAWWIGVVGLPDLAPYGMALDHVSMVNIEAATTKNVTSDGKATIYLPYITYGNPAQSAHTNKLRWVIEHPAGVSKRFQMYIRTFA